MANELTTQAAAQIAQQQEMAASSKKQRWQQAELSAKDVRAEKHTQLSHDRPRTKQLSHDFTRMT
jgi:hypothetical protein